MDQYDFSDSHQHHRFAAISLGVMEIRIWERQFLACQNSIVAMDLLVLVAHHSLQRLPLSCKSCYSSLNYSSVAIRKQLCRYEDMGWILIEPCEKDRRVRWVKASPKFEEIMDLYAAAIAKALGIKQQHT